MSRTPSAACSQALEGLTLASSGQGIPRVGRSNSTQSTGLCLLDDFQMPSSFKTFVQSDRESFAVWKSSPQVFPARTLVSRGHQGKEGDKGSLESEADSSARSCDSLTHFAPAGWCLRTWKRYSRSTMAKTLPSSSRRFESAGMWDAGECWTLSISARPRDVVAYSWSQVIENSPPLTCWLMPHQWEQYLARCLRAKSHGPRTARLAIVYKPITLHADSPWGVKFSSLTRTDGVRWLSVNERMRYMGFPPEWMTSTLEQHTQPVTPWFRKWRNGSPAS